MIVISEKQNENYNAGPKAPRDINSILKNKMNYRCIEILIKENKNKFNKVINVLLKDIYLWKLKKTREYYLIQMPFSRSNYFKRFIEKNNTILLVHDLVGLRYERKNVEKREIKIYKKADFVIVHNNKMKQYLIDKGIEESKIFELKLFDYICKNSNEESSVSFDRVPTVVYAGNLSEQKSPFIHSLNYKKINFKFKLYGIGLNQSLGEKLEYCGSFLPEELPNNLNGSLGLVWDGNLDESDEESGFKRYTKYNNPHKLSCYMAAGLPVIVWNKSAISDFVIKNNIGYTINNIYDINNIDFNDYEIKKANVDKFKKRVRDGYYTQKVIKEIMKEVNKNNDKI